MRKKNPVNQVAKWFFIFFLIIGFAYAGQQYYINNIIHADDVPEKYKKSKPKYIKTLNKKLMQIKKTGKIF